MSIVSGGDDFPSARKRLGRCLEVRFLFVFAIFLNGTKGVLLAASPAVEPTQGQTDRDCDYYPRLEQCRFSDRQSNLDGP